VAAEAAEPLGIPVLPVQPFGLTPSFAAFPGSVSLRTTTLLAVVRDVLDSLYGQGFRRVAVINGHGGNVPARAVVTEWVAAHDDARAIFHSWFDGPRTWAVVESIEPRSSHASWMENFPWTRLAGVALPRGRKEPVRYGTVHPRRVRELIGDGSFAGSYERSDEDVLQVWQAGVEEVRDLLEHGWD
ncbi:MAG TPA: creatininase family protein, partial [Gaiellaceae bacterium]|nr:creatininase family protein [Gaiellaceae bacterium]